MEVIIFVFAALGALAGGLGVVASRLPVRNALSLLLVLGSLAVTYLLLAAQFIAVLQVIVYAGAIVVLFLFVVMLLHRQLGAMSPDRLRWQGPVAIGLSAAFLILMLLTLRFATNAAAPAPAEFGTVESVGRALFTSFALPFEVASVILLLGIIAAVVIGRPASRPVAAPPRSSAPSPVGAPRR